MINDKNGLLSSEEEEEEEEEFLLVSCKNPPKKDVWYRSGKDGLWYNNRTKATSIREICVDGVYYNHEDITF